MSEAPQDQIAHLLTEEGWELLASLGPPIVPQEVFADMIVCACEPLAEEC